MTALPFRPKIALVCSAGGHLTELLALRGAFEGCDAFWFCYDSPTTRELAPRYLVPNKPYNPLRYISNFLRLMRIFRHERPDCVVSTGAEIAIPAFLLARLLRIPTLYIECGAQVATPSLTGRLLSRVADEFYVQWPELVAAYGGRARYAGSLIDTTTETTS